MKADSLKLDYTLELNRLEKLGIASLPVTQTSSKKTPAAKKDAVVNEVVGEKREASRQ